MSLYLELFDGDSSKMDSTKIYVDSMDTSIPLYIGDLPKGSRIRVYARTSNIPEDRIRVKSEHDEYMPALTAIRKNTLSEDLIYDNYFSPTLGKDTSSFFRDSNEFVTFSDNHYYLEISGEFNNESTLRLKVLIDSTYFKYIGEEDSISMKMTDTVRGIINIDKAPEYVSISFSATEGYSVNLTTIGKNIDSYKLANGDSILGSSTENIDTMLVPKDSIKWKLNIFPRTLKNYTTGPYAIFEAITKSRKLEQGEYFAYPDSIPYPGEWFKRTRPRDDPDKSLYKYNLRQEQFIWIGDYKKGDSIIIKHDIKNYSDDNFTSPVTLEFLDKNQKVQGKASSVYGGSLSIKGDMPEGPYYLHYMRINSYPLDSGIPDSLRYVLQLFTLVQQPGLLKSMQFFDPVANKTITEMPLSVGDTIHLNKIEIFMETVEKNSWNGLIGSDISWFVPCASLAYINNNYDSDNCDQEYEVAADFLVALEDGLGQTAKLIAQSVGDPTKRDTIDIPVILKAE